MQRPLSSKLLLAFCGLSLSACTAASNPPSPVGELAALDSPLSYPESTLSVRYEADRVREDSKGPYAEVTLLARDFGGKKSAGVRASIDGGAWFNAPAEFLGAVGDGWDRWRVLLRGAPGWVQAQYAVYAGDGVGAVYWDNNISRNYVVSTDAVVHRVGDVLATDQLAIDIDVKNLAYEKQCSAAVTGDGWITVSYFPATYQGKAPRSGYEHWRAEVSLANPQAYGFNAKAASFEYAVTCTQNGESAWDNNNTSNYRRDRAKRPLLAWQSEFEGASSVAVAADGVTFVLSSSRWISGYSQGGQWLFAKQAPAEIASLVWLESAELLLGRVVATGGGLTWVALNRQGDILWTTTAQLSEVVRGLGADYLLGAAGGARLRTAAPEIVGPTGGCNLGNDPTGSTAFPIANAQGKMFCLDGQGTIRSYDLNTGASGPSYGQGWPWAASDSGSLVVVSTDRTTLVGYSPTGEEKWRKKNLYVAVDTQYGTGTVCANHAHGDVAVFLNQSPGGGNAETHYLAGFNVATGTEQFKNLTSNYTQSPCAGAEGAFYYRPGYEHYGRTLLRVDKQGKESSLNLGMNGQLFGVLADGRALRRDWSYYPNDKGRIVVTNSQGDELFNASFYEGKPAEHLAALSGEHLVVAEAGKLYHFQFLP